MSKDDKSTNRDISSLLIDKEIITKIKKRNVNSSCPDGRREERLGWAGKGGAEPVCTTIKLF